MECCVCWRPGTVTKTCATRREKESVVRKNTPHRSVESKQTITRASKPLKMDYYFLEGVQELLAARSFHPMMVIIFFHFSTRMKYCTYSTGTYVLQIIQYSKTVLYSAEACSMSLMASGSKERYFSRTSTFSSAALAISIRALSSFSGVVDQEGNSDASLSYRCRAVCP